MGASNSTSQKIQFFTLKQKAGAKDEDTPGFALFEKVGDKYQVTQLFNTLEGRINSGKIEEKEFKQKKEHVFVLEFTDDAGEKMKLTMPHGGLTYSILNSLASECNSMMSYKIFVRKIQSKDGKYWNAQAFINANGSQDMQKWSVDPKATPQADPILGQDGKQIEVNGDKLWDKTKQRAFWEQLFKEKIASKLSGDGTSSRPTTSAAPATNAPPTPQQDINTGSTAGGNDDVDLENLPF